MMPTWGAGPESGRYRAPLLMPGKAMYSGFDCADAVSGANNVAMPITAAKAPASLVCDMTPSLEARDDPCPSQQTAPLMTSPTSPVAARAQRVAAPPLPSLATNFRRRVLDPCLALRPA